MRHRTVIALTLLCVLASSATAWDGTRILEATADLRWELFVDSSPTPVGWVYWQESGTNGVDLVAEYGGGADQYPGVEWYACCTEDSMAFRGSWLEDDPENYLWNFQLFDVELFVRAYAPDGVRIVASRDYAGQLTTDEHSVTVTDYGDLDVPLLAAGTGDEAFVELPPGAVFMVTLRVDALEHGTHYAYDGNVTVRFEDVGEAPVVASSWSAVKGLFD